MMKRASLSPGEDIVIEKFVEQLRDTNPGLQIEDRPDKSNRDSADIDAVAGIFAIEHTSVDTIDGQRRNNAAFLEIIPDDDVLSLPVSHWVSIGLSWDAVERERNRLGIKTKLTEFIQNELRSLGIGRHTIELPDTKFTLHISVNAELKPRIHIGRLTNGDQTLSTRVADLTTRKAEKLARYKQSGKTTVLLLETEDIALMNRGIMLEAIHEGFKNRDFPKCLDQIWYADTSIPSELVFIDFTKELVALGL